MKIAYDPTVDALTIRFVEERVECEVIRLNDRVAVDIGPGECVVAIEVLDASEVVPDLVERGVAIEGLRVAPAKVTRCDEPEKGIARQPTKWASQP
ncbi:MAG: DUF2283 domain-containing protein [Planctomycetes bacterium]|nr:DUF2283 domain-containing protein [Planctomycetota bacterium]